MKNKIREIMSVVFEVPVQSITDDASTSTIENWDSLNHMNLIVALEEEFNTRFEDDEITKLTTLSAIEQRLANQA